MESTRDVQRVVQRMFEGFNAHDREAVAATLSEDFAYGPFDRDGFVEIEFAYVGSFSDMTYEIDDLFAASDRVAIRWRFIGTHDGDRGPGVLSGVPPTGKRVEIGGISIARIEAGRIAEWWGQWNHFGLLCELGVIQLQSD